jgi:predicted nuclease with TOPRIM domain
MRDLQEIVNSLQERAKALVVQLQELSAENEELIGQVIQLKQENERAENRINELENKSINLQFSNTLEIEDKEKLKSTINELLTEIDKGLELLKG